MARQQFTSDGACPETRLCFVAKCHQLTVWNGDPVWSRRFFFRRCTMEWCFGFVIDPSRWIHGFDVSKTPGYPDDIQKELILVRIFRSKLLNICGRRFSKGVFRLQSRYKRIDWTHRHTNTNAILKKKGGNWRLVFRRFMFFLMMGRNNESLRKSINKKTKLCGNSFWRVVRRLREWITARFGTEIGRLKKNWKWGII